METALTLSERLKGLKTLQDYQVQHANLFPSITSLRWFMRTRRERLNKAQALVVVNGRLMIDPEPFCAVLYDDGCQAAVLSPADQQAA